ncbi:hypothetical protein VFPPC_18745 [Pochonia chlamydosporia 170]|uniref:Uncharacterized protein n=1 Tax=Pochonia chlamydosporia 170 TaxID=1380566 RepID=A0A219ARY0_METCM|nr:hypothetical protein VFPPC_18745 [Pochonia chlamydosporia 170]OWT43528.1 hypothetical protein VFPPC_18745 [Pochonia chlamydosporia 170]
MQAVRIIKYQRRASDPSHVWSGHRQENNYTPDNSDQTPCLIRQVSKRANLSVYHVAAKPAPAMNCNPCSTSAIQPMMWTAYPATKNSS